MAAFLARRVGQAVFIVLGVSVVVFVLTHLIGDPARLLLPLDASHEQYLRMRERLGLDVPLLTQLGDFLGDVVRGDFGVSLWFGEPALEVALSHVWPTIQLALAAIGIAVVVGIPMGFLAAVNAGSWLDRVLSVVSLAGVSVANFWLSLMLIMIFAVQLGLLPTSGYGLPNLVLPALAASAYPLGQIAQMSRSAMLEELRQPYIVAIRAKGVPLRAVVARHAGRNALIPVMTVTGFEFGRIVGGFVVVVEVIFAWPGIAQLTFTALSRHDFPLIQACIFVVAVLVVLTNLVVDALYSVVDPRVTAR